jgi:hypothetical protein
MAGGAAMRDTAGRPVALGGIAGPDFDGRRGRRGRGARAGDAIPQQPPVNDRPERRTNHALRRRIDQLIGRVRSAEEEIVQRGLDAVQETKAPEENGTARPGAHERGDRAP